MLKQAESEEVRFFIFLLNLISKTPSSLQIIFKASWLVLTPVRYIGLFSSRASPISLKALLYPITSPK